MACCSQGASGQGKGTHPAARRAYPRAPQAADGEDRQGVPLRRSGWRGHLVNLFEGRRQLMVYHFIFSPEWDEGCPSCSAGADEVSKGLLEHLHARETTLAYVSRTLFPKLEAYQAKKGWIFPWYSSYGSDFNYDFFHVTLDESVTPIIYNYGPKLRMSRVVARPTTSRASSPSSGTVTVTSSCAMATTSSTPTPCTGAAPRPLAVRTTSWT